MGSRMAGKVLDRIDQFLSDHSLGTSALAFGVIGSLLQAFSADVEFEVFVQIGDVLTDVALKCASSSRLAQMFWLIAQTSRVNILLLRLCHSWDYRTN